MINEATLDVYKVGIRIGVKRAIAAIQWDSCDDTRPGFREHAGDLCAMLQRYADECVSPDDAPSLGGR